ncbi:hypothetical protein [Photobacterium frigidiphilum]|uniref:hypothetical protein n=1 Tax=Photobacterium frigidiphilum TaxID=264736 RepID=UPI00147301CB|nr:hypothetical protein [Photobacterium frigidiphilum]
MNAKASGKVLSNIWGANNQAANHSLSLMSPYFVNDGRTFTCGEIESLPTQ